MSTTTRKIGNYSLGGSMKRSRLGRACLALTMIAGFLLGVGGVMAGPAAAVHNPCGAGDYAPNGLFAGNYAAGAATGIEGVYAELTYRNDFYCNYLAANNKVSSWSSVGANNGKGYAQSGQINGPGYSCMKHFAEQLRGPGYTMSDGYGSCVSSGEVHQTWSEWVASCSCEFSVIDVTVFLFSSWNPYASGNWQRPFNAQYEGETAYTGSDVPGTGAAVSTWVNMQVQRSDNDDLASTCMSGGFSFPVYNSTNYYRYFSSQSTCNSTAAWTAITS